MTPTPRTSAGSRPWRCWPVQLLAAYQASRRDTNVNPDETGEPDGSSGPGYGEDQPFPDDAPDGAETTAGDSVNPFLRPAPFRPGDIPCCPHAQTSTGSVVAASTSGGYRVDWARLLPAVTLYLHLAAAPPSTPSTADGHDDGDGAGSWVGTVVRWEGEGPVTTRYLREVLGPLCRFTVKPVLDLTRQAPVTAYETPAWMREAVHLITGGDVYPYAPSTSRRLDLDHAHPYRAPRPRRTTGPDPSRQPRPAHGSTTA